MTYGNLQSKQQLFLSHQCFISISRNIDSLNQLWNCYSSFTFKPNLLHKIIRYFLMVYWSSVSNVFVVEKELLRLKHLGKFYSLHPWLFLITWKYCHQYLLSMIHLQFLKTCQSFLEIIQHHKNCLNSQFLKQLEMTMGFYFTQKIVIQVMMVGLGNILFVRQLKLMWQNQKLNIENFWAARISFQAPCLYFAYYLRIWDVLLNCMRNLWMM